MKLTFQIATPSDPRFSTGVYGYGGEAIVWPILWACEALSKINEWHLDHGAYPLLYESGLRYKMDPMGEEWWYDIPSTLSLGYADCKKLAAWRVAELRKRFGIAARPYVDWKFITAPKSASNWIRWNRGDDTILLIHVLVMLPDGTIEDPSSILGMSPPWVDDGERHYR